MPKKIIITGKPARRIEVTGKPQRRIEPGHLAAALGAEPIATEPIGDAHAANLDPVSLAALGSELIQRLRSTGGRPALADATEFCRVPLNAEDTRALEQITERVSRQTGVKPSPGQVASVILRSYLRADPGRRQASPPLTADKEKRKQQINALETSAKEIQATIERRVQEVVRMLREDGE